LILKTRPNHIEGMVRRHKWKFILLGLPVVIVLLGLVPWSKKITLDNGGYAHIKKASLVRSLWPEAYSTVSYEPKSGQSGKIVLWQDIFDGPVTLLTASDTNVLLCLYDYDVDFRLFRIDTDKMFKPLSPDSDLKHILFSCTWEINDGTEADWQEVLNYLHKVPPNDFERRTVSVGLRIYESPNSMLKGLEYQGRK
jgi:hypothetical protein